MDAKIAHSLQLGQRIVHIPHRNQAHRDEASGRGCTPFFHMPVIPCAAGKQGFFRILLGHGHESAAGKARHGREIERRQHTIGIHVVNAQLGIVCAGPQLAELAGFHAIFAARPTDDRIEADGGEALAIP